MYKGLGLVAVPIFVGIGITFGKERFKSLIKEVKQKFDDLNLLGQSKYKKLDGKSDSHSDIEDNDSLSFSSNGSFGKFENQDVKMVLVLRADLNMTMGKICAQCAHAAVEAAKISKKLKPDIYKYWSSRGCKKIVVRAETIEDLDEIEDNAISLGLVTSRVIDAGYTQIPPNTTTFIGIGPGPVNYMENKVKYYHVETGEFLAIFGFF